MKHQETAQEIIKAVGEQTVLTPFITASHVCALI